MRNKQFKRHKRKPANARLRENRLAAIRQEAENRYQYHQLRLVYLK